MHCLASGPGLIDFKTEAMMNAEWLDRPQGLVKLVVQKVSLASLVNLNSINPTKQECEISRSIGVGWFAFNDRSWL